MLEGEGWSASLSRSQIATASIVIALGSKDFKDIAVMIDKASGTEFGRMTVSSPPWAALRTNANQILMSDLDETGGRLLVFSSLPTFKLEAAVRLSDRSQSTTYTPGMALSGDQRFLFYLKLANGCAPAPRTSQACDRYQVGVIDLNQTVETAAIDLPADCGFGLLSPGIGSSDVKVLCPNVGTVVSVTNSGSAVLASFARVSRSRIDTPPAVRPYLADRDAAGEWLLLLNDGAIVKAGGATSKLQLPRPGSIHWSQIYRQPDGTYLLGIATYGGSAPNRLTAVARFDPKSLRILSSTRVPDDAIFFAPESGNVMRLLSPNGTSQLLVQPHLTVEGRCAIPVGAAGCGARCRMDDTPALDHVAEAFAAFHARF
ncbi:MAG: hypothetical protein HYX51_04000, partial [Chloroflexi bacterium]|nr:hypothetical protein [Chloroflexota bacterium]